MPLINLAPKWALSTQAIHSAGHPFLAEGNHLRMVFSESLGLPVAPFLVYRAPLGHFQQIQHRLRHDIIWTDSRGNLLTLPFTMPPDGQVTGWLPPPDKGRCVWIRVDADPSGEMEMSALTHNPRQINQPNVIGRTGQLPFMLAASRIDRIELRGQGMVTSVSWIDAVSLSEEIRPEFWRILSLPVEAGSQRYIETPNARPEAEQRILEGAPPRMSRPDEFAPAFSSSPTPGDEFNRLQLLRPHIEAWLGQLLNDTSEPIHELQTTHLVNIPGSNSEGFSQRTVTPQTLGLLLQSSIDPGIARWLGFMTTDLEASSFSTGELVAYFVEGFFSLKAYQAYIENAVEGGLDPRLLPAHLIVEPITVRETYEELGVDIDLSRLEEIDADYINVSAIAIATINHAPLPPARPDMDTPVTDRPFLPAPPPTAIREVLLPARKLEPLVGLVRRDSDGDHLLNDISETGRAVRIVSGPLEPGLRARDGAATELSDRLAPAEVVTYRVAHADWFGRWSDWTEIGAPGKERPHPPVPAPQVTYRLPEGFDPNSSTPLAGTLRIDMPVPQPRSLSPGSHLLQSARITVYERLTPDEDSDEVVTYTPLFTETAPGTGEDIHAQENNILTVLISRPEIELERATIKEIGVSARFLNQVEEPPGESEVGQPPRESDIIALTLVDPRPPLPVSLPITLKYTARPDATGLARVDLRWTPTPTQRRFRVFYSDEVRLRGYLEAVREAAAHPNSASAAALLSALDSAPDQAVRAQRFKDNARLLGRVAFEQLTADPLELPREATEMQFDHAVSGSLEVLSFYRVVAVSAANVEASFAGSALVPVAVPNALPPNAPDLSLATVRERVDGRIVNRTDAARLVIEVPRGPTTAAHYRLRRSQVGANTLEMPIVEEGVMPPLPESPPDRAAVVQRLEIVQTAPPLQPWRKYYWRAEVRAGAVPGTTDLFGMWSRPTLPVSAVLIPSEPPPPIENLAVTVSGRRRTLSWQHPQPLDGGSIGLYSFEIFHFQPSAGWRSAGRFTANAAGRDTPADPFTFVHIAAESDVLEGEMYRVVLYDPLNRASAPESINVPIPSVKTTTLFTWWHTADQHQLITSHPDWSGDIGDSREGFQLVHIEGQLFDPDNEPPSGVVSLDTWQHRTSGLLVTTTDPSWLNGITPGWLTEFRRIHTEGFVFEPESPQPEGTISLFTLFNRSRKSIITTSDPRWIDEDAGIPSRNYRVVRLEGYIFDEEG